ncbi:hypothetical protein [Nocardia sp. NPDC050406]|uniref:hypothetical protein n=1 Tax=Nocardia sp. NPDC050406 TaxID=3364318 RepID=UPI0037A1B92C
MTTSDSPAGGKTALILAGTLAGPVAAGGLALLSKPFGGILGIPGAAVGYIVMTCLVIGCVTALLTLRWPVSRRVAGGCAVLAGAGFAVAGLVSTLWVFVAAVLVASAAAGPLIVAARMVAFESRATLTGWQVATAVGAAGAGGMASLYVADPGTGLVVAGALTAVLGALVVAVESIAPRRDTPAGYDVGPGALPRGLLIGYAVVGALVGGTILPALHLLLFRWNTFGAEQTNLLLLAVLSAALVLALPGPDTSAVPPLLVLGAGGPLLVATAPGESTLAIGLAVTLIACARAARGLDFELVQLSYGTGRSAAVTPRSAAITALVVAVAGAAGLGLVAGVEQFSGTGTGLTLLSVPTLIGAVLCGRAALAPRSAAAPLLQGGIS